MQAMNYKIFTIVQSNLKFKIKMFIKKTLSLIFSELGYGISINSTNELIISRNLEKTLSKIKISNVATEIEKIDNKIFQEFILNNIKYWKEGLQVLWILFIFDCKKSGYFVEFGACDGVLFSNTNLLEKDFGWTGILAEPNRSYKNEIGKNRKARIHYGAVWSKSGESIEFAEITAGGLSGIYSTFRGSGGALNKRESLGIKRYMVETISLNDLLNDHNAPIDFDLLSIDTEGSEFEILNNLDLKKYRPKVILVESDGSQNDAKQFENLLSGYGYKSVGSAINDEKNIWFVHTNSISKFETL